MGKYEYPLYKEHFEEGQKELKSDEKLDVSGTVKFGPGGIEIYRNETKTFDTNDTFLRADCRALAPLVANGNGVISCGLGKDHEGDHEVIIRWTRE